MLLTHSSTHMYMYKHVLTVIWIHMHRGYPKNSYIYPNPSICLSSLTSDSKDTDSLMIRPSTYIHIICIHTYIYFHIHTHVAFTHTHMHMYIHSLTHSHTHTHTCTCSVGGAVLVSISDSIESDDQFWSAGALLSLGSAFL